MRDTLLFVGLLALAFLYMGLYELNARVDFIHAWNKVKKERVDRLAKGICEEECKNLGKK